MQLLLLSLEVGCSYCISPHGDTVDHNINTSFQEERLLPETEDDDNVSPGFVTERRRVREKMVNNIFQLADKNA